MSNQGKQLRNFAKYSALGFQMGAICLLSVWGGLELDNYIESIKFPLFTIIFSFFGVFAALYLSLKDFFKTNK